MHEKAINPLLSSELVDDTFKTENKAIEIQKLIKNLNKNLIDNKVKFKIYNLKSYFS